MRGRPSSSQLSERRPVKELVAAIVKSHVPLAEEEPMFMQIREKDAKGEALSAKERELLLSLVEKAKEWERAVQSSAQTEREETLSG